MNSGKSVSFYSRLTEIVQRTQCKEQLCVAKKVGWAGSYKFVTNYYSKFLTKEIVGAQNFNLILEFLAKRFMPKFYNFGPNFLVKNFLTA